MSVRGIFTSHSGLIGERQNDLSARVLMTGPGGSAPMLALSAGMPSLPATQTSFTWIEDAHISGNSAVVTGGDASATSIEVEDVNLWMPHTVLMNENTGEYVFVTAVNSSTNTITIERGISGTTAQAITAADRLQLIASAYPEGGDRPEAVSQKGEERSNYTQIFKNGWAITGTAAAIGYITGSQLANNRSLCFQYHAEEIERSFLWGRKGIRTLAGKQLRLTHGIISQIEDFGGIVESANTGGVPGALSMIDLQDFMRRIFDIQAKGMPNERIAYTGSKVLSLINEMVLRDSRYNIEVNESEYGITVTVIKGFNARLKILTHPMMTENSLWNTELYVLHPGMIHKRPLRRTWTEEFDKNKQNNNGKDAIEGYIADEMGFEIRGAKTMGILRNIQTAVNSF